mgnify:CR=1 FL=1
MKCSPHLSQSSFKCSYAMEERVLQNQNKFCRAGQGILCFFITKLFQKCFSHNSHCTFKGPRDLESIRSVVIIEEKKRPLVWDLDFVKDIWNIEISNEEPKNPSVFFCKCSLILNQSWNIFQTLDNTMPNISFPQQKNHIDFYCW